MVIFKVQCVELTKVHTKVMEAMQNILNSVLEQKSNQTTRLRARLHSKVCPSIVDKRRSNTIGWKRFYEKACNRFGNANVTHVAILSYGQVGLVDSEFCCSQRQKARVQLENCKAGCKLGRFSNWIRCKHKEWAFYVLLEALNILWPGPISSLPWMDCKDTGCRLHILSLARALVKQTVVKMVQQRLWGQPRGNQADEGLEGRSWLVTVVLRTSGEFHSFIAFISCRHCCCCWCFGVHLNPTESLFSMNHILQGCSELLRCSELNIFCRDAVLVSLDRTHLQAPQSCHGTGEHCSCCHIVVAIFFSFVNVWIYG